MIKVAVVVGVAMYLFCVVMAAAGFTSIVPLIVTVPVLVLLIGGGNMLGGRSHGRTRSTGPPGMEPAPLSSSGANGSVAVHGANGDPVATDRAAEPTVSAEPTASTGPDGGEPGNLE